MKSKIFKQAFFGTIVLMGLQTTCYSQGLTSEQEKQLEQQTKALELKMKKLESKLDDFKIKQKGLEELQQKLALKDFTGSIKGLPENLANAFKDLGNLGDLQGSYFNYKDWKMTDDKELKEHSKTYSKTYSVDKGDKLLIDNKFGNVNVNTWANNEFKVDVTIKVGADNDDDAQKMLNSINIEDSKDGSAIAFKTNIQNSDDNSWSNLTGSHSHSNNLEVNYTIYMPTKNALEINNKFGSINIPDFEGKLTINSMFGSFAAKNLANVADDISNKYGSTAITGFNGNNLKVAYGSLNLGEADKLNAEISYSSANIGKIKTSGTISLRYVSGFKIADLDKNLKNLQINSAYSSIAMGVSNIPAFDFDVTVRYGSFSYNNENVSLTNKSPADGERGWSSTTTYKGHYGKGDGDSDRHVVINANYTGVKFN